MIYTQKYLKIYTNNKKNNKRNIRRLEKLNVIDMELITNIYSLKDKYTKEEYLLAVLEEINEANNLPEKFNSR